MVFIGMSVANKIVKLQLYNTALIKINIMKLLSLNMICIITYENVFTVKQGHLRGNLLMLSKDFLWYL